jgi:hypothetical protein
MDNEARSSGCGQTQCPVCAFKAAYEHSDIARHVRGVQRESLLLMRSLLNTAVQCAETKFCAQHRPGPAQPAEPMQPK